jgi:hypothetical protein
VLLLLLLLLSAVAWALNSPERAVCAAYCLKHDIEGFRQLKLLFKGLADADRLLCMCIVNRVEFLQSSRAL